MRWSIITLACGALLASSLAEARPGRGGARTSVSRGSYGGGYSRSVSRSYSGGGYNRNVDVNRNVNRNVGYGGYNRNVNVNRDIDVDVDRRWGGYGYGYGYGGYPVARGVAAGAAVATAAAIGSVVYSLPPSCATIYSGGVAYQQCGGAYYRPQYTGTSVSYVVVNPP